MTASAPPAPRAWSAETPAGFALRFAVIVAVVVTAMAVLSRLVGTGVISYLPTVVGAVLLAAAYRWRRAESLLAFAMLILFYDTLALFVGPRIKQLDEATVPLLVLLAAPAAWRSLRSWWWWPREATLALAMLLAIGSSLVNGVPAMVWFPALVLVTKAIAFYYVALWSEVRVNELRGAMVVVLGIGIVVLGLGFIEVLNPPAFQEALGLHRYERMRGGLMAVKSLFFHPVLFAWFSALVAIVCYAYWVHTRRPWALLLGLAFTLGPFLAGRRRAILALAGALGTGFVRAAISVRNVRALAASWVPVAVGGVLVTVVFLPLLAGLVQLTLDRYVPDLLPPGGGGSVEGDGNPQARIALYYGSVEIASDHFPLGAGLGRYGSWMSRVEYSPLYEEYGLADVRGLREQDPRNVTDTFWPQILGEFGVLGLAAYAAFLGSIGWLLWREAGRPGDTTMAVLRLAAGMILAQALVESLASPMFHSPPRAYLLFGILGVASGFAWRRPRDETAA